MDWEKFKDNVGFFMAALSLVLTVVFGIGLNRFVGDADPLTIVLVEIPALVFGGVAGWSLRGSVDSRRGKAAIRSAVKGLPLRQRAAFDEMMENDGLAFTGMFEDAGDYEALEKLGLAFKYSDHADATGSAGWMVKPEVRKALKERGIDE